MNTVDTILRVDHPHFTGFLWALEDEGFSAQEIIRVIEKPWKWQPEFEVFLATLHPPIVAQQTGNQQ